MLNSQKIAVSMSEKREKVNELLGLEVEQRAEDHAEALKTLTAELQAHEVEYRAALTAEGDAVSVTEDEAEPDRADLEKRASVANIVSGIMSGKGTDGAEAELQAEMGLDGDAVPLALLGVEQRAAVEHRTAGQSPAPADVGASQQPIIPAVWPQAAASFLGVEQPTVPVGDATFTVLGTSLSAGEPDAGDPQASSAGAFVATVVEPKRLQGSFFIRREDKARLRGMESALRQNLSEALMDKFDSAVLATFLAGGVLANIPPNDAGALADFAKYRSLVYGAGAIDGVYASTASQIKVLLGVETYAHAATIYRSNTADDSALDSIMRASGGVRVSAHIPDVSGKAQSVIVTKGAARRNAVAPIWEGVQLIEDAVTQADEGEIKFTAVMLWGGLHVLRKAGFVKRSLQVAA